MQKDSSSSSQCESSTRGETDEQDVKRLKINPEASPHRYPQNTYRFRKALAIIANFKDYHPSVQDKLSVREGSEHDVDNLKRTFESMKCIDVEDPWVTADKLNGFLDNLQIVADDGFDDYDCFILVVMAHGAQGGVICGLNAEDILIKDIWGLFTADKCRSLANKPKFFFFQACRGDTLGRGVHADDESPVIDIRDTEFISIPVQADMLLVFSTFEGSQSLRSKINGTPFIQDLCAVLYEDNAKEENLREPILNLMNYLCNYTASRSYDYTEDLKGMRTLKNKCDEDNLVNQIPIVFSTLRKDFYFRNSSN